MSRLLRASEVAAAVGRGLIDPTRRRQLALHLQAYMQEEAFIGEISRNRAYRCQAVSQVAEEVFPEGLLVTSSAGLYLLAAGNWTRLLATPGYGVATDGAGTLFAVCSPGNETFVVRGKLAIKDNAVTLTKISVLCGFQTRYHGERMHQIAWDATAARLICANTRRNSLLFVNPDTGEFTNELFPFTDRFGYGISTDHNHINGVAAHLGMVLFSAHTLGVDGAALGFIDGDRVRAYKFGGRGVHDVLLHDGGVVFTDSFRSARMKDESDVCGAVIMYGQECFASEVESLGRQLVLRGVSARRGAICVGASIYAKREERFEESGGGVLVFRGGSLAEFIPGPFSQVYDVLPLDGQRTDLPMPAMDADELDALFSSQVGPCVYDEIVGKDPFIPQLR